MKLLSNLKEQVTTWSPLTLILLLGSCGSDNDTPASYIKVITLYKDESSNNVGIYKPKYPTLEDEKKVISQEDEFLNIDQITKHNFKRIQEIFSSLSDTNNYNDQGLVKMVDLIKTLTTID